MWVLRRNYVDMCCFTAATWDCQRFVVIHSMTAASAYLTRRQTGTVLTGVPVVPGVRFAPVIRANRLPAIDELAPAASCPRRTVPPRWHRFAAAAAAVAQRLRERAASGHRSGRGGAGRHRAAGAGPGLAGVGGERDQSGQTRGAGDRGRGRAVHRDVHQDGWADGRTGHRPQGHPRPGHRRTRPGCPSPACRSRAEPSILCAEDLAPADTAGLDPHRVVGLATTLGGPTSHTAIIARQLGIPVRGRGAGASMRWRAGTMVLLDGSRGTVTSRSRPGGRGGGGRRGRCRGGGDGRLDRARVRRPTATRCRSWPTWPTDRPPARRGRPRSRESGCSGPSCASSTATPSRASRSRLGSTPRCSRPSPATRW